jgi:integrating conjugative element protein (TIGR03749 family)
VERSFAALLALFLLASSHSPVMAKPPKASDLPPELAMPSPDIERLTWNKLPLQITLSVNQERLVTFNVPVRVDLPKDLDGTVLRTQIVADANSGTIYWTALKPFTQHRVQVQDIQSGNIYLVDIEAGTETTRYPRIEVTVPTQQTTATMTGADPETTAPPLNPPALSPPISYIALTRMAAQQLYAPERLVSVPAGVYRSTVRPTLDSDLFRGGFIEATPLIAWRADDFYITAVKLQNRSDRERELDPRTLRGTWLTATFQHNLLKPHGHPRDTTAGYFISRTPYGEWAHDHEQQ